MKITRSYLNMTIFCLLATSCVNKALTQTTIDDQTIVYGKILKHETTGKPLSKGCYSFGNISFNEDEIVAIVGTETCFPYEDKGKPTLFFLAMRDTGAYYVPASSVHIYSPWGDAFKHLTPDQFQQIRKNAAHIPSMLQSELRHIADSLEIQEIKSEIRNKTITDSLALNQKLKEIENRRIADSLEVIRINQEKENKRIADSLDDARFQQLKKFVEGTAKKGICVYNFLPFDISEYTDGTGMEFTFFNSTTKVVKYIYVSVTGFNAVDDPIVEGGKTSQSLKCIGPIESQKHGTYSFDYVWFTDLVNYARITYIKVQYMDGTEKIISKPAEVIVPSELKSD